MKFRTDFVTNSSSSSYCVSLVVNLMERGSLYLNLLPKRANLSDGSFSIPFKGKCDDEGIDDVIERIRECENVGKLTNVLLTEYINQESLLTYSPELMDDDIMQDLDETSETYLDDLIMRLEEIKNSEEKADTHYYDDAMDLLESLQMFKERMSSLPSLDQVRNVIIREDFEGWGEGGPEALEFFFSHIDPEWDMDSDQLQDMLKEKLTENEISDIVEWVDGDRDVAPNGSIITTISFPDGSVQQKYSMSV